MNCKHVEELLPLYVGRDLEEKRARLITSHLQGCTQCARSAHEYVEAGRLLQLFEPPQFSEANYAAVRSRVLREIERESSAPTLFDFILRPFQSRVMWAVSTAVLLAVCAFAYYFIANRANGQRYEQASVGSEPDKVKALPAPSNKDTGPEPIGNAGVPGSRPGGPAGEIEPTGLATRSPRPRLNRTTQVAWRSKTAGESGTSAKVAVKPAQDLSIEQKSASVNSSVTTDKSLRLEIQTNDRNIRIIWFLHPSTNEGSPTESSKGI